MAEESKPNVKIDLEETISILQRQVDLIQLEITALSFELTNSHRKSKNHDGAFQRKVKAGLL
jgi:hypothetical protein